MEAEHTNTVKTITRSLPCRLTDDELMKAGSDLATVVEDITNEESRQTDQKTQMKAKLTELDARRSQLAIKVRRREEFREVEVEIDFDYQRGMITEIRTDTGEQLNIRRMTDSERQQALPLAKPNGDVRPSA